MARHRHKRQEFVPFAGRVLTRQISADPMDTNESQIQIRIGLGDEKQQCKMFHWECRRCFQSMRNQKTGTAEHMGERDHQPCDWSTLALDRRQVDSGQTRSSSRPNANPGTVIWRNTNPEGKHHKTNIHDFGTTVRLSRLQCDQGQETSTNPLRSSARAK